MKSKEKNDMDIKKVEDVKDTALKLNKIRMHCPEEYYYLKGWIHCLLQNEDKLNRQSKCHLCK